MGRRFRLLQGVEMTATKPAIERPSNIRALAIMTIVSGALNLVVGLSVTFSLAITLVGLICTPITILPAILGVFEILYGAKLLTNPPQPVRPSQTIAILEIITFLYLNVISGVVGILALLFYNDPEVQEYFGKINS
jgi:hypothetical protein